MTDAERLVETYRYGKCYAFAVAAHRVLGCRIGAAVVELSTSWASSGGLHMVHTYCIREDGTFFDAGGTIDMAHLEDQYLGGHYRKRYTSCVLEACAGETEFISMLRAVARSSGRIDELEDWLTSFPAQVAQAMDDIEILLPSLGMSEAPAPAM